MRLYGDGDWREFLSGRPSDGDIPQDIGLFDYLSWFPLPEEQGAWLRHVNGAAEAPVPEPDLLALDR